MSRVIVVENLCKQYRLGAVGTGSLAHDINRTWHRMIGNEDPYLKVGEENDRMRKGSSEYVWALKDVNFEVNQGEVLGIIGRNGAGKSTLLKILSRTTAPTGGSVKIKGRVASLLEVGTGFHPELSGRENIFLNGAILGMNRREIKNKFDEIVNFAGVERYIDTPVKRYSSGMYVRLAFGVAAHLEPDILIVDEVLAVGDAEFQKKALGKMKDVSSREGRTVLFVSHNMQAISTLTSKCIFMHTGKILEVGKTKSVISKYLSFDTNRSLAYNKPAHNTLPQITKVFLQTSQPNNTQVNGDEMKVYIEISTPFSIQAAAISLQFFNRHHIPIVHLWQYDSQIPFCREPGVFELVCTIPGLKLYQGAYTICLHFADFSGNKWDHLEEICPFEVVMFGKIREYQWQDESCAYIEDCNWNIKKVD